MTWLAIAAMWLLVAAPTVTRVLPSAWPDPGAWCTGHGLSDQHPSSPDGMAQHADQCGYCTLLGHSPWLGGSALVELTGIGLSALAPAFHPGWHWHALPLFGAQPRGPPSLRHG